MSGHTPYMAAIWNAGVDEGRPTDTGSSRWVRWRSRRRNGMRPWARACSSTGRERPSICTTTSGSGPETDATHEPVHDVLQGEEDVVERHTDHNQCNIEPTVGASRSEA